MSLSAQFNLSLHSLLITSNLAFSRRGEIFTDDVVAVAMIDRLVHHAEVISLDGNSYRTSARRGLLDTTTPTKNNYHEGVNFETAKRAQFSPSLTFRAGRVEVIAVNTQRAQDRLPIDNWVSIVRRKAMTSMHAPIAITKMTTPHGTTHHYPNLGSPSNLLVSDIGIVGQRAAVGVGSRSRDESYTSQSPCHQSFVLSSHNGVARIYISQCRRSSVA